MPFQRLLDSMRTLSGVEGVAFLDSEGELILSSGALDPERLKVLGAYQGIFLSEVARVGFAGVQTVCTRYKDRVILTQALKDGYFISVVFSPDVNFAYAQHRFREIYQGLEKEL